MSYQIAVLKYRAVVNPSEVFEFDAGTIIPSNPYTNFFINDFLTPETLAPENKLLSSELTLRILDKEDLVINKDYTTSTVKVILNGQEVSKKFFEIISEKLSVDSSKWSTLVIDCLKQGVSNKETLSQLLPVTQPTGDLQTLLEQANEGLSKEDSDKLVRYREANLKIEAMDKEVSSYQTQKKDKEELKKKKESNDNQVKAIEDKLASVNMLIESRDRIKGELDKFRTYTDDLNVKRQVDTIKTDRSNKLISDLKSSRKASGINMESEEKESNLFVGKWILILAFIQVIGSLVLFVTTLQAVQLFIGLFSAIVLTVLMLLVNVSRYTYELKDKTFVESNLNGLPYSPILPKTSPEEDKLILNTAWGNALNEELKLITDTINSRLGGKDLEQLMKDKEAQLAEQKNLNGILEGAESKNLNTEEYYKKRRELDILKIEKENIEFALEGKMKPEIEKEISSLSSNSVQPKESLPLILVNCNFLVEINELINNLKQSRQVLVINNQ